MTTTEELLSQARDALITADRTFAENGLLACHAARQEIRAALDAHQPRPSVPRGEPADEVDAECQVPPLGWRCTRGEGHEGPCAAVECPEDVALVANGTARLRAAGFFDDATAPAAPAPAAAPDAQALQQARWEGIQSVRAQTAEIVRAAIELLDAAGESFPPDALAAFKRVFGGAAPAVAAPEPLTRAELDRLLGQFARLCAFGDDTEARRAAGEAIINAALGAAPTTQEQR